MNQVDKRIDWRSHVDTILQVLAVVGSGGRFVESRPVARCVRVASVMALSVTAALLLALLPLGSSARAQQCVPVGTNQICTNSIFLSGGATGLFDNATLKVTNTAAGFI